MNNFEQGFSDELEKYASKLTQGYQAAKAVGSKYLGNLTGSTVRSLKTQVSRGASAAAKKTGRWKDRIKGRAWKNPWGDPAVKSKAILARSKDVIASGNKARGLNKSLDAASKASKKTRIMTGAGVGVVAGGGIVAKKLKKDMDKESGVAKSVSAGLKSYLGNVSGSKVRSIKKLRSAAKSKAASNMENRMIEMGSTPGYKNLPKMVRMDKFVDRTKQIAGEKVLESQIASKLTGARKARKTARILTGVGTAGVAGSYGATKLKKKRN